MSIYELAMEARNNERLQEKAKLAIVRKSEFLETAQTIITNEYNVKMAVLAKLGVEVREVEVRHDVETINGSMVKLGKGVYARVQTTTVARNEVFFLLCNKVGTPIEGTVFHTLGELADVLDRVNEGTK